MGFKVEKHTLHCAYVCASLALLAGSGDNAGCNGGKIPRWTANTTVGSNKEQFARMSFG